MPLSERIINYLFKEPRNSIFIFWMIWFAVAVLSYLVYKFAAGILLSNKTLAIIALIPCIVVFLLSLFMSNYQVETENLLLPAPFLFSLLTYLMAFGVLKYVVICFGLVRESVDTGTFSSSTKMWLAGLIVICFFLMMLRRIIR